MKNFRIKQSKNGYFFFEKKEEVMYFYYSYFEFLLKCIFGIKKIQMEHRLHVSNLYKRRCRIIYQK